MTAKTPEEQLAALERLAAQHRKDAEIIRAYIELQKRLEGKKEVQSVLSFGEGVKSNFEPGNKRGEIKGAIIQFIKDSGRFVSSAEIRVATERAFPDKDKDILYHTVRDCLAKDAKRENPAFVVQAQGSKKLYGVKEFLEKN